MAEYRSALLHIDTFGAGRRDRLGGGLDAVTIGIQVVFEPSKACTVAASDLKHLHLPRVYGQEIDYFSQQCIIVGEFSTGNALLIPSKPSISFGLQEDYFLFHINFTVALKNRLMTDGRI